MKVKLIIISLSRSNAELYASGVKDDRARCSHQVQVGGHSPAIVEVEVEESLSGSTKKLHSNSYKCQPNTDAPERSGRHCQFRRRGPPHTTNHGT